MPSIDWGAAAPAAVVPFLAVILDLALGDPPGRWHPVSWMGSLIEWCRPRLPSRGHLHPFLRGGLIVVVGVVLWGGVGIFVTLSSQWLPVLVSWLMEAAALKMTIAARGLALAAGAVRQALEAGDLPTARGLLAWHLVSRDTTTLSDSQVAAATIESVAENTSDGLLAPLFWYAVGGLPAAFAYRFVNTADAILGYRDPEREWLGKIPARLDDLLNLIPSRGTALLFLAVGGHWQRSIRIWWRDCRTTASPNAGHPMAAAAGVLGVELEKVGAYTLGAGQRLPVASDVGRAVRLLWRVTASSLVLLTVCALAKGRQW